MGILCPVQKRKFVAKSSRTSTGTVNRKVNSKIENACGSKESSVFSESSNLSFSAKRR